MATKQQFGAVKLERRAVLMLGLAGASTLVLGKGTSVLAAEEKGVERKVFKNAESMIPGFPKVQLRAITYQPGANTKATMKNPMICECTRGTLEVTQDGKTWTAKTGDIWTCKEGMVEANANKGKTVATMRVFDLLPA
jgi:quercetin dioxygenase-like cupin family protein